MPAITGIAHAELTVTDLDTSSPWYSALFGAREVFRARDEEQGTEACALVEPLSGIVFAFTRHDGGENAPFSPRRQGLDHLAFAVEDLSGLEAWLTRLDELNIPHSPIRDYGYAHAITFSDPDGIALEFFVQKPRS